jgi:hypothetical protein
VGNGEKINIWSDIPKKKNIWSDAWVPSIADRKITTPRGHDIISTVCELIDPVTGQWDEELVNETFSPVDVQHVMAIPLPTNEMDDFVAWSFNKNGVFSVRSAYHVEWNHQHNKKMRRTNGVESQWNLRQNLEVAVAYQS